MRNLFILASLVLAGSLFSEDNTPQMPNLFPIEVQQCNFKGNKDMDDFMSHIDEWNDFLDAHSDSPYVGWVLTPHYRTASDFSFDFGWLGGSNTWESFGAIYDAWMEKAPKLAAKFDRVRSCDTQTIFAAQAVRQLPESSDQSGVLMVSNCKVLEGVTPIDIFQADAKWNAYLDSIGNEGGIFRWYPAIGAPSNLDYDFKYVLFAESMSTWGQSSGNFVNGGGIQVNDEIFGNLLSCDSARMYQSNYVRQINNN